MFNIDAQITINKKNRATIAEAEQLQFQALKTEEDEAKIETANQLVQNNSWLQTDKGEELDSYLTAKNVRIVLLIMQKECDAGFYLTTGRPKPEKPKTRSEPHVKDQLLRKVQVGYCTFDPDNRYVVPF